MNYDSGYSVRIINVAKGLIAKGNSVSVIMPKYDATKRSVSKIPIYEMNGSLPKSLLRFFGKISNIAKPSALYFFDPLFVFRAASLVKKADIVQVEQPVLCLLLTKFIRKTLKKPIVIDCHDVFQGLRLRHNGFARRVIETVLEKTDLQSADLLITVSAKEKEILLSMNFPDEKIIVAPNGVDIEAFSRLIRQSNLAKTRETYGLGNSKIVVFMGNLTYVPNLQALNLISSVIAPKVRKEVSDVKFVIVGKKRETINLPDLIFTGYVDNVADLLAVSDIGIVPLLEGAGTRLKILEYLSSGLPVVSTSVGAEGLQVKNGSDIIIEDNIDIFANRIVQLLKNDTLCTSMSTAGKVAAANYDWEKITDKLDVDYRYFLSKYQAS